MRDTAPNRKPSRDPLAERIDRCREQRGWTVADLAMAAGVHISTCRYLLRGAGVNLNTLRAVAHALGLEVCLLHETYRVLREHGTAAAMSRHRYHREPPCTACKAWDAERKRAQRQKPCGHTPGSDSAGEAA